MSDETVKVEVTEIGCWPVPLAGALVFAVLGAGANIADAIKENKTCPTLASTR